MGRIELGQEEYGTGDRKIQALRYYFDELLDDVVEWAKKTNRSAASRTGSPPHQSVRVSPATTVIACCATPGLRLPDARAVTGPPGAWVRLPQHR
ncbi:hypothetical protein [Nonomuraea bangladeshensis]|uniref:hypothetical protein n=1 Tax=Nonomuraea bangladeshensis TaxID=404385 RepID=UPI003C2E174C